MEPLPGLTLLAAEGHVPGHVSALARLPAPGPVLLTIDAVMASEFADPDAPRHPFGLDPASSAATACRPGELAARESVTLTVYGHAAARWPTLRLAPDFHARPAPPNDERPPLAKEPLPGKCRGIVNPDPLFFGTPAPFPQP